MRPQIELLNNSIAYRRLRSTDLPQLVQYLHGLSPESKNRFGPHPFTEESIKNHLNDEINYQLFIACKLHSEKIIAYTILKKGWVNFDEHRLYSYHFQPTKGDYTLAPSVSDEWQNKGVGSGLFEYILQNYKAKLKRIFLWGGVQSSNTVAINFYLKHGFKILGEFEHNGNNLDMVLEC